MKKILTLAVGATVLFGSTLGVAHQASAQTDTTAPAATSGSFADVPADHWAYSAVDTLRKAGIVIGYPDGTYGGRRAMTRYEFAVAIARLLPMVQQQIDTSQFVKTGDFQAFQSDVNNRLQQQQAALDALRALVNEFQPELQQLGQNVDALNKRLDADEARLAVVEEEQKRLKITGDVSFIASGYINNNNNQAAPIDQNGYRIDGANKSLFSNINVYHDILLNFDGKVNDNTHAIVKIDASNYSEHLGSYTSQDPLRVEDSEPAQDKFSIYEAYVDAPLALGNTGGGEAWVGRIPVQFTPLTLKAIDPDVYTNLPETDSGDVIGDGAKVAFGVGGFHVQGYATKNSDVDFATLSGGPNYIARSGPYLPGAGTGVGPYGGGGSNYPENAIDQSTGARITLGTPDSFVIGVSGVLARTTGFDSTGTVPSAAGFLGNVDPNQGVGYNTIGVYSADGSGTLPFFKKSGITVDGEFANSTTGQNSRFGNVNKDKGTEAYYAELGYTFGPVQLKGGYKNIYPNFAAPGYWGRLGSWTNYTNVDGGTAHVSVTITPTLSLVGDGNFFKGEYNTYDPTTGASQSPLGSGDKLNQYQVGLKYGLSSMYGVDLGYEYVQYNLKANQGVPGLTPGKPTEEYITLGLGATLSHNSSLKLLYQIIDYQDKGTGFDPAANGGDEKGGVALTQFNVKF